MNLLPSLLVAATIVGSVHPIQIGGSFNDKTITPQSPQNQCITGQIIIGNSSDTETILDKFCINIKDIFNNCLKPSVPDTEVPCPGPETLPPSENIPDTSIPEDEIVLPSPEQKPESEETIKPAPKPDEEGNTNPEETPDKDENNTNLSYMKQVVTLVNKERAKVNLPALTMTEDLNRAAHTRAIETTKSFSHTRPNGSSFATVLTENNISYRSAGENIAWGQKTPEEVVTAWMNSSGHRANILNKKYTSIGVGYYLNNNTPYWAQLFTY